MIAPATTPHPAQVTTSASHTPAGNVTSASEVPIGASILWAFFFTATHNLTLPEHNTLSLGLQQSVPETTLAPQEVYSTPQLQTSTATSGRVSQPLPKLVPWTKSSITEVTLQPSRTMPVLFSPLPQQVQTTPLVLQLPREGSHTTGQGHNSLMARLIDDKGGTRLLGGNTIRFSSNGRLLAEPRTISPESFDKAHDSLSPQTQPPSDESKGSPELLTHSLVTPDLSASPESSPQPLTAYFVPESDGLSKPLTTRSVLDVEASPEPEPEPLPVSIVAEAEASLPVSIVPEAEASLPVSIVPEAEASLPVSIVPEAEASPEPEPEAFPVSNVPEAEASPEPEPEPLPVSIAPEAEASPEPLTTHSLPEAEDSLEPAPEEIMTSTIPLAKSSPEPPPEPLTAFLVASQPYGEAETLTGSSAAAGQATPPTTPAGCSSSSQQPPGEGCSNSAALQASESSSFLPEAHEMNETVNDTAEAEGGEASQGNGIQWSTFKVVMFVIQFVIMVETVFGNLMVILSVKMEKKLQTPFNYYIVNLAFTDMNVGISVMSLFMIYNLYDYFPFNAVLCHYWVWSDYTMTFESVMTLAAISIDRLWSVTWSLHYRNHNSTSKSLYIILGTWCLVALIWLPPFLYDRIVNVYATGDCYWDTVLNKNLVVYVGFLGYYTPLFVMLGAYARILLVVRKRAASIRDAGRKPSIQADPSSGGGGGGSSGEGGGDQKRLVAGAAATQPKDDKQEQKLKREMKAVYTLLNIVVIFLLCWVPFYILFVLSAWFPTLFPTWYVTFSYWMAYINSAVNPILYPLSSPEFRQAYKKVIRAMIGRS